MYSNIMWNVNHYKHNVNYREFRINTLNRKYKFIKLTTATPSYYYYIIL